MRNTEHVTSSSIDSRVATRRPADLAVATSVGETRDAMAKDLKSVTIKLRVTEDEQAAWQDAAAASGMTISDWIRQRCNGPAALPPERKGRRS